MVIVDFLYHFQYLDIWFFHLPSTFLTMLLIILVFRCLSWIFEVKNFSCSVSVSLGKVQYYLHKAKFPFKVRSYITSSCESMSRDGKKEKVRAIMHNMWQEHNIFLYIKHLKKVYKTRSASWWVRCEKSIIHRTTWSPSTPLIFIKLKPTYRIIFKYKFSTKRPTLP